jgi:hypothetical protein
MLRIKLVLAVVGSVVAVMMARDISLSTAREIRAYESWQGPPVNE